MAKDCGKMSTLPSSLKVFLLPSLMGDKMLFTSSLFPPTPPLPHFPQVFPQVFCFQRPKPPTPHFIVEKTKRT